ncbi:MAG: transporter [Flavobacteriales bacterium]|nr:transporter [Flavobacteriales bacterium]
MIRALVFAMFLVHTSFSYAQYTEKMVSGRPGQAIAAQTPGMNVFQLETGFDYTVTDRAGYKGWGPKQNRQYLSALNATLLRYGILNNLEIHSGWEFREDKVKIDDYTSNLASGMSFSSIGIRHNVFEGNDRKPSLAYQVSIKLNILSKAYNYEETLMPHFMVTSGMSLTENLGITLNSGMDFTNYGQTGIYILNLGYSLGDRLFTFAEMYGSNRIFSEFEDPFAPKFDAGFGYFLTNDMQLDVLGGYAINEGIKDYFVSTGISWRLNHPKAILAEEIPAE